MIELMQSFKARVRRRKSLSAQARALSCSRVGFEREHVSSPPPSRFQALISLFTMTAENLLILQAHEPQAQQPRRSVSGVC